MTCISLYELGCAEITPWRLSPGDYTPNSNPPERNPSSWCAYPGDNPPRVDNRERRPGSA